MYKLRNMGNNVKLMYYYDFEILNKEFATVLTFDKYRYTGTSRHFLACLGIGSLLCILQNLIVVPIRSKKFKVKYKPNTCLD